MEMRQDRRRWGRLAVPALAALTVAAGAPAKPNEAVVIPLRYLSSVPVPVARLPGSSTVIVPLYPGSQLLSRTLTLAEENPLPGTPYFQGGGAVYRVPAGAAAVMAWYRTAMAARGFTVTSRGQMGGPGGTTAEMLGFTPRDAARLAHPAAVYVTLSTGPAPARLVIWATRIMIPPRPAWTYLSTDITAVTGTLTEAGTAPHAIPVDVRAKAAIARLTAAVNSLRTVEAGALPCPMIHSSATLVFHEAQGRIRTVQWNACVASVNRVPFVPTPALDRAVESLFVATPVPKA